MKRNVKNRQVYIVRNYIYQVMCSLVALCSNLESAGDKLIGEKPNILNVVKSLLLVAKDARNDIGDYDKIGVGARFFDEGAKRPDAKKWIKERLSAPKSQ